MSLIQTLLWSTVFFLLGTLGFIGTPLVANNLPMNARKKLGDFYFDLSAKCMERMLLYIKQTGEIGLMRPTWDDDHDAETIAVGDATRHYVDTANQERRLFNKPLSFGLSEFNTLVAPIDALVGSRLNERKQTDQEWLTYQVGDDTERAYNLGVGLPDTPTAIDMQDVRHVLTESFEPTDVTETIEYVKKSQQGYKTHNAINMLLLLMIMGSAAGLAWLIWSNSSVGGDSVVNIPLTLMVGL